MSANDFQQRLDKLRDSADQKAMISDMWKLSHKSFLLVAASTGCIFTTAYFGFTGSFGIEFWIALAFAPLCFVGAIVTQQKALMSAKWQDRDYLCKSFNLAKDEYELEQAGFPYLENAEVVFYPAPEEESYESSPSLLEEVDTNEELSEEESDRQAKVVYQVKAISQMLVLRSKDFDTTDSYEVEQVDRLLNKAETLLPTLTDAFYAGAARHSIIDALVAFNRIDAARALFAEINDRFIKDKVLESYTELDDA